MVAAVRGMAAIALRTTNNRNRLLRIMGTLLS
jgi:DNA-binding phage protein